MAAQTGTVYDFTLNDIDGKPILSPFHGEVEWNFQKYLVDRQGNIIARYHHRTKPLSYEIVREVERELASN
ncbi:MAG: hypothetical protein HY581_12215 [Nitrospirae bacterium]|nr:hypothetical protein [Nitrospirota bacterium]